MQVIQPIQHVSATKPWSVTYGVNVEDSAGAPQTILDGADTDFRTAWRPLLDTNMTLGSAVGYFQPLAGPLELYTSIIAPQAGSAARNSPPPQVATVIRKRTAAVGKAYRGRCFFPGLLDETNVDENGIITPAGVIALQAKADIWMASRDELDNGGLWLFHQKSLVTPTPVTNLVVQPIVRTQRRRLPRG
jgi:hypothetical protein